MKWRFSDLKNYFEQHEKGANFDNIFSDICDIAAKTLIGADDVFVEPFNRKPAHRNNSFEVFGFDILIDSNYKTWLIEVPNISP